MNSARRPKRTTEAEQDAHTHKGSEMEIEKEVGEDEGGG